MGDVLASLARSRVVPVVTIHSPGDADPIAEGLSAGGIGAVEITLRTPAGLDAIRRIASRGDLVVGAGTVLDTEAAHAAADAGAAFIVSPGLDQAVVDAAVGRGLVTVPGIATPTELQAARRLGLTHVKVFPAAPLGGLSLIQALHAPFPEMRFMPSGGVTLGSAPGYLAHPAVFAVGASWLVPGQPVDDLAAEVRVRSASTRSALGYPS